MGAGPAWWPARRLSGRGGLAGAVLAGGELVQAGGQVLAFGAVGVGVGLGALQPGAQPGDRFFQRAQLRLVGGGERGGMPAVVVAELGELVAGGLVAGAGGGGRGQRGVALGARGGDRGLGFCLGLSDLPGGIGADLTGLLKRRGAVVIRGGGAGFGVSARGLGGFHGGDGLGGGGAGFGRLSLGGVRAGGLGGQFGAGGFQAGGGL